MTEASIDPVTRLPARRDFIPVTALQLEGDDFRLRRDDETSFIPAAASASAASVTILRAAAAVDHQVADSYRHAEDLNLLNHHRLVALGPHGFDHFAVV